MKFTVLIPTFDNGIVVGDAIESVLTQTVTDLELFVVADGAPAEVHELVTSIATHDTRVRLFRFDKGERHGELWRHAALDSATGEAVCYLCDDDYWFPDHLEKMAPLLASADFAHTRHTAIAPNFTAFSIPSSIADASIRQRMANEKFNIFGPTVAGHRMDAYRRLAVGWAPGPSDLWSDLHMWRKWIAADGIRYASSPEVTTVHLPRSLRKDLDSACAEHEARYWHTAFKNSDMREALRQLLPADGNTVALYQVSERAEQNKIAERAAECGRVAAIHQAEIGAVRAELNEYRTGEEQRHLADTARIEALAARGDALQRELNVIECARGAAEQELEQMRNTATWRYTAPLRAAWAQVRTRLKRLRDTNG